MCPEWKEVEPPGIPNQLYSCVRVNPSPLTEPTHRYLAVASPLRYHRQDGCARPLLLISATWLLAALVAAPVLLGLNDTHGRDPATCRLEDRDYVVASSACSFFLPCPLMLLLYGATFRSLRRWEAARRAKLVQGPRVRSLQEPCDPVPQTPHTQDRSPCDLVPAGPGLQAGRRPRARLTVRERKAMKVLPVVVGG